VAALTYEQFLGHLRSALHYLYDPVHLRRSPLVTLLGVAGEFDKAAALEHALAQAIGELKPPDDEPPQSRAWRVYDVLSFQYLRQSDRTAVAMQLGISERQLRREQRLALEALARHLWRRLSPAALTAGFPSGEAPDHAPDPDNALSEELVWLKQPTPEERVSLAEVLQTVCDLAQPLAEQWEVVLQIDMDAGLADLPVTQLALRSIVLTILTVAIPRAGRGPVLISAARQAHEIDLQVACSDQSAGQPPLSERERAGLETAQNLAEFYGARLAHPLGTARGFSVALTLPAPQQRPVLVIDDNADWLELLQRYATGSRYQIIGTREPATARRLAEKVQPAAILLDVMMANIDGWQVLSELRHEPATSRLPVIICTILPVESLALSLGANAFLQKPVTQEQFLQTLDRQIDRLDDWPPADHPALL
jgi:CheY-like chemotaxis protein